MCKTETHTFENCRQKDEDTFNLCLKSAVQLQALTSLLQDDEFEQTKTILIAQKLVDTFTHFDLVVSSFVCSSITLNLPNRTIQVELLGYDDDNQQFKAILLFVAEDYFSNI